MSVEIYVDGQWVRVDGSSGTPTVASREAHTYAIEGNADSSKMFVPFSVSKRADETLRLVGVIRRAGGGSATIAVRQNGATPAGFGGITMNTVKTTTSPDPVELSDSDEMSVAITAGSVTGWASITLLFDRISPVSVA